MNKMMKAVLTVGALMTVVSLAQAGDAAEIWGKKCASCHGKTGAADTAMGKKFNIADYTKEQKFTDAEAATVIKTGKEKMKGYKDLSDEDIAGLIKHIRAMKK